MGCEWPANEYHLIVAHQADLRADLAQQRVAEQIQAARPLGRLNLRRLTTSCLVRVAALAAGRAGAPSREAVGEPH
jgi:hypothetical protein